MKAYALRNQLSQEAHNNIDNLSSILVQSKVEQLVYKLTYQLTLICQSDELQLHLGADACIQFTIVCPSTYTFIYYLQHHALEQ